MAAFFNFPIENPPSLLIQLSFGVENGMARRIFFSFGMDRAPQSSLVLCHSGLTDLACVSMGRCVLLQLSGF